MTMKLLAFFLLPFSLLAQDKLKVEYEKRSYIKLEGNSPQYRQMEEQFSKPSYIQLLGDQNRCSLKTIDRVTNTQGPSVQMKIIGAEKDIETYMDFTKDEKVVSKDVDGKLFLITSKTNPLEWKISRETKKINGFNTKKATFENEGLGYEVWYSTEIKSKCGPEEFYGLPGLVLEAKLIHLEKPENYTHYQLDQLTMDDTVQFSVPTKGKSVTAEEYATFRKELDKRLQENYGNQGVNRD